MESIMKNELEDNEVGILKKPLEILKHMSYTSNYQDTPQKCALLVYERTINQKEERYNGKVWGYYDFTNEPDPTPRKSLAKTAVILVVISLENDWKIPLGLFFVDDVYYISYVANTIKETLTTLKDFGIHIVCVSMDCLASHKLYLARQLGVKIDMKSNSENIAPYFDHIDCGTILIYFQLQPLLDQLKNFWRSNKLLGHKNNLIYFGLVEKVKRVHKMDLPKSISEILDDWTIIEKRLKYDEDDISKTVADALEYLKDIKHPDFNICTGTIQFIRMLEFTQDLSDNLRVNPSEPCFMNPDYEFHWKPLINKSINYFKDLKKMSGDTSSLISRFQICITGIRSSLLTLRDIYEKHLLVDKKLGDVWIKHSLPSRLDFKNVNIMFNNLGSNQATALRLYKYIKALSIKTYQIFEDENNYPDTNP